MNFVHSVLLASQVYYCELCCMVQCIAWLLSLQEKVAMSEWYTDVGMTLDWNASLSSCSYSCWLILTLFWQPKQTWLSVVQSFIMTQAVTSHKMDDYCAHLFRTAVVLMAMWHWVYFLCSRTTVDSVSTPKHLVYYNLNCNIYCVYFLSSLLILCQFLPYFPWHTCEFAPCTSYVSLSTSKHFSFSTLMMLVR